VQRCQADPFKRSASPVILPTTVARFEQRYTAAQKEAAVHASVDRGIPGNRILQMAAAGELRDQRGDPVPRFTMPLPTLRSYAHEERKRRRGDTKRPVAQLPHRDAIEQLRSRIVVLADTELERLEKQQRKGTTKLDLQRASQVLRLIREAAALPDRTDARPVAPGARQPSTGKRTPGDSHTQSGLAKQILADHQAQGRTAQDNPSDRQHAQEHATPGAEPNTAHVQTETGAAPGSIALASAMPL
jgi:hypothetical protein